MASIFRALDGGHLDRALFGSHPKRAKGAAGAEKVQKTRALRRSRIDRAGEATVDERGGSRTTPPGTNP